MNENSVVAGPSKTRDRLVLLSIVLVATAVYGILRFQFGVAFLAALAAAVVIGSFALLIHFNQRRSTEIKRLNETIDRLQRDAVAETAPEPSFSRYRHTAVQEQQPDADYEELAAELPKFGRRYDARGGRRSSVGARYDRAIGEDNVKAVRDVAAQFETVQPDGTHQDQWSLKANDRDLGGVAREPHLDTPISSSSTEEQQSGRPPVSTIDEELSRVQMKIKALTEQVDGPDSAVAEPGPRAAGRPAVPAEPPKGPKPDAGRGSVDLGSDNAFDFDIEASIGALRSASQNMRQESPSKKKASEPAVVRDVPSSTPPTSDFTGFDIPVTAQRIASSSPESDEESAGDNHISVSKPVLAAPKFSRDMGAVDNGAGKPSESDDHFDFPNLAPRAQVDRDDPFLKQIELALRRGAVDVLLSPIVDLKTHSVNLYNVEVCLKSETGEPLQQAESHLLLTRSALAPVFDSARLVRAVSLAHRLDARGRGGVLLSGVSGLSLTDAPFLDTFAEYYDDRPALARLLAPTITQAEIERLPQAAWQALQDMHAFGFSFAIDELDHADINFEKLASYGFKYVKLDSSQFLAGLPSRKRFLTAEEVCQKIKSAGLTMVAGNIADERARSDVIALGIQNGLGSLFGTPRIKSVEPYTIQRRQTSAA